MTHEEFQAKLQAIPDSELAKKAYEALSKLCKDGARSFTMTVPPRIDDTDMIFSELIRRYNSLRIKETEEERIARKALKKQWNS